nr:alpha/beta hydrolase [Actibacterium sp. 188UL27-1]
MAEPEPCAVGIYRGLAPGFVAVTRSQAGLRYTFSDGRTGALDQDGILCNGGRLQQVDGVHGDRVALRETDTVVRAGDIYLAGRLIEPPGAGPHTPLVVYAHGSEETGWLDHARDPYQMVGRGISVFVYDKRGTGRSGGVYTQNFPQLADDLVAASREAKRLAQGRFGRFGLFGLSQGGWVAPLAARRAGAEFIGVGYGLVIDIREEDAAQVAQDLQAAGYGAQTLADARLITDATARIATTGSDEAIAAFAQVRRRFEYAPWFGLVQGDYTGLLLSVPVDEIRIKILPRFVQYNIDWSLDPVEVVRAVEVPQLWVLAAADRQAPVDLTLERLIKLRDAGLNIAIHTFPTTDHGMWEYEDQPDGSRDFTRITAGFYDLMADWAKGALSPPYGRATQP